VLVVLWSLCPLPPPLPIIEFTDTVINTYGFVVALVRWQMVTFVTSAGVPAEFRIVTVLPPLTIVKSAPDAGVALAVYVYVGPPDPTGDAPPVKLVAVTTAVLQLVSKVTARVSLVAVKVADV
jgi:hypothetical protein